MNTIETSYVFHQNRKRIALTFEFNSKMNNYVRKIPGARFSKTIKCWHLPCDGLIYRHFKKNLPEGWVIKEINDNKKVAEGQTEAPAVKIAKAVKDTETTISKKNIQALDDLVGLLQLKSYSQNTIKTYKGEFCVFLGILKNRPAESITAEELKRYMLYCVNTLHLSENTIHSRLNALKFYYEQVLKREKFFFEIPRPKKQLQLPNFFNQDEITQIIKQTDNLKHKTMLMLAYSTGMRVSEVVSIKVMHVDSKRMQIKIVQAKGKKDRMVALSPVLLVMLREYFTTYKLPVDGYLFPGQKSSEPYSTRSLQLVLKAAKERAGIMKPGSVHALRHSFATHLLDKGTDVTMIMKLLGHNEIKTTLRYLHVTNRDVLQIISPLDGLDL
ncbi:MAG: site-specific integrase [Ferruginibacter sp.]